MPAIFGRNADAEQPCSARFIPKFAFDLAIVAPSLHALFRGVLLIKFAHSISEDRDFLVFHEFGLWHVDDGHVSLL